MFLIDTALKEWGCTMISASTKYTRWEDWIIGEKIPRKSEKIQKLQQTISTCMQELYTRYLTDTLNQTIPILYIDCATKWEKDIILFIGEQYACKNEENKTSVLEALHRHSIVGEIWYWKTYGEQSESVNIQEIFNHYTKLLKKNINNQENLERMYGLEYNWIIYAIAKILRKQDQKYLYLYLDNAKNLSVNENSRLNNLLYTRGSIYEDRYIRLKINNGDNNRKTRSTNTWQRAQATHDYTETSIKELDIE